MLKHRWSCLVGNRFRPAKNTLSLPTRTTLFAFDLFDRSDKSKEPSLLPSFFPQRNSNIVQYQTHPDRRHRPTAAMVPRPRRRRTQQSANMMSVKPVLKTLEDIIVFTNSYVKALPKADRRHLSKTRSSIIDEQSNPSHPTIFLLHCARRISEFLTRVHSGGK